MAQLSKGDRGAYHMSLLNTALLIKSTCASPFQVRETIEGIADTISKEELALWLENYPIEDYSYATKKSTGPFPGYRTMLLRF